jgi:hypothetical protein
MNMKNNFEPLESYDVLSINFKGENKKMFLHPTFKVSDLMAKIRGAFNDGISWEEKYQLFGEGIACEVLKLDSKGWQKGRIRLNIDIQFYPDELDETESFYPDELDETESFYPNELDETESFYPNEPESPLDNIRQKLKEIEQ